MQQMTMISDSPLDTCDCGDYRRDHKGGTGACAFNRERPRYEGDDGHMGAGACHQFRLCERAIDRAAKAIAPLYQRPPTRGAANEPALLSRQKSPKP